MALVELNEIIEYANKNKDFKNIFDLSLCSEDNTLLFIKQNAEIIKQGINNISKLFGQSENDKCVVLVFMGLIDENIDKVEFMKY